MTIFVKLGLVTNLILNMISFSLFIVVTGGFALINNDKVTILVNEAELGSVWFAISYDFNDSFFELY